MAIQHDLFQGEYIRLIGQYSEEFRNLSKPVADQVVKLLARGVAVNKAVSMAFDEKQFFGRNQEVLMNVLFQAATYGFGVEPDKIANPAAIKRILLHEAWAPDKMNLSTRLHGTSTTIRKDIVDTISSAMLQKKNLTSMARDLYDGYNSGKTVINKTELPQYLKKLENAARKISQGDKTALKEFNNALANAQANVEDLSSNGAPTKALKAAYSQLLNAAENLSEKAIDKAVRMAIEEKSRYLAERIARTEISAAYGESFFAKHQNDSDVIAYRWVLSSRHPRVDICDINANSNFYSLGPGVYPKNKYPKRPAHPHCYCLIEPVYEGEIHLEFKKEANLLDNAKFNPTAGNDVLKNMSEYDQKQLLGVDGWKAWKKSGEWQSFLRGWNDGDKPATRFKAEDFGVETKGSREETARRNIINGDYDLTVQQQKQNRHIEGTKDFDQYTEKLLNQKKIKPGILDVDAQTLIDEYKGTGRIIFPNNAMFPKEVITADYIVGRYYDQEKQQYVDSHNAMVVYSKKGIHTYPVKP